MRTHRTMKSVILQAAVAGCLVFAASMADALENTGFEVPVQAAGGYKYTPAGASWSFSASAGLSGKDGPWKCNSISPDPLGAQFAYLQGAASISQTISGLAVGASYVLSFYESYRTAKSPGNTLSVTLDEGLPTEMTIYNNPNVSSPTWALRTATAFVAEKSSYTLTFRSTNQLGDTTTIIDGVTLEVLSATWISYVKVTNDADCDIRAFKTYTHKLDFGQGTPGALINGVQFDAYNTAANGTLNFINQVSSGTVADHSGNGVNDAPAGISGNLYNLMKDMYYNGSFSAGGTTTWKLSGLTAGVNYDVRIYVRQWRSVAARTATIVFDPDGAGPISDSLLGVNEDDARSVGMGAANDAYYISYRFTAVSGEDLVITATQPIPTFAWHLYGITNEVIPPAGTVILIN